MFKPFTTHTGLLIYVREDEGLFTPCIVGDREKELFSTRDAAAAEAYAEKEQAAYELRAKEEASGNTPATT